MPEADKDKHQSTIDQWSEVLAGSRQDEMSRNVYWLAIPEVDKRYQTKAVGGAAYDSWVEYCLREFLKDRLPAPRMLSLGCGAGGLERTLAGFRAFVECDAYDIAPAVIEHAKTLADQRGMFGINYHVADLNHITLPHHHYDAVWFHGSLHHIEALEHVLEQVRQTLKPDGFLFFNEYVGPSRMRTSARQAEAIRHVFRLIPERYRQSRIPEFTGYLQEATLPDPDLVEQQDPSESVRSGEIMEVVQDYFNMLAVHPVGGTLLHYLLHGIAGNFRPEDPDSMRVLEMLFTIEDTLLEVDDITSDFMTVAASPKEIATPSIRSKLLEPSLRNSEISASALPTKSRLKRIYHLTVPVWLRLCLRDLRIRIIRMLKDS